MAKGHILVVDDEEDIRELLRYNLAREGYQVSSAGTGEEALEFTLLNQPDLIVLDLMLPGINGLDVCRKLKLNPDTTKVPIIILSARGADADIVSGLELGAEDYVVKPFSPQVLCARVRAVLRRKDTSSPSPGETLRFGPISLDPIRFEVICGEQKPALTSTEFKILQHFLKGPGCVYTRSQIVTAAHGEKYPVTERSIDVQIVSLRKKLGSCGDYIETVRGVGYRFRAAP